MFTVLFKSGCIVSFLRIIFISCLKTECIWPALIFLIIIKTSNYKIIHELHVDIKVHFIKHLIIYLFRIIAFYYFQYDFKWVLLNFILETFSFSIGTFLLVVFAIYILTYLPGLNSKNNCIYGFFCELTFWYRFYFILLKFTALTFGLIVVLFSIHTQIHMHFKL